MWIDADAVKALCAQIGLDITAWDEDEIEALIAEGQAEIEMQTGRTFDSSEAAEILDGNGGIRIVLSNYPVISVESVKADDITLAADDFKVDKPNGIIGRVDEEEFTEGFQNVEVNYHFGYDEIPSPLISALTKMSVGEIILRSPTSQMQQGIKSIRILNYSVSYNGLFAEQISAWAKEIQDIIRKYKKVVMR
jgi:hypothetical protein